ncbi:MAG: response regulator [Desulfocapsaceae bacterium]|nr:response regulator [Desulfocapsaceae bacterium]
MREKTILLVDDEQPILDSLGNYLERKGFNVTTAPSGEEALAAFDISYFDLTITDLAMGGMNGIDFLKEIKNINSESCVFILTGEGDMASAIEALQTGAEDYILKPCDPDELILKMERVFEKQTVMKRLRGYEKFLLNCMYCKKIQDDNGSLPGTGRWLTPEEFLILKSGFELTHGCCPECYEKSMWDLSTD